jgi:hypothetical protein
VRSGAHEFFNFTDFYNAYYLRKAAEARQCWWVTTYTLSRTAAAMATLWNVEKRAATIIQAVARGMCCRVWLRGTRILLSERRILLHEKQILLQEWRILLNDKLIYLAATIIQATARGRAVRAWNPFVSVPTISQTDTDKSYDSDDFLVMPAGLMRVGEVVRAKVYSLDDAAAAAAMWRDDAQADADESVAAAKAVKKFWANVDAANAAKSQAATIIQAAERGRVVRMVVVSVAQATEVLQLSKFVAEDWEGIAVARAVVAMGVAGLMKTRAVGLVEAVVECHAATIIQAAARGRAVRLAAWDDGFAALDGALLEGWEVRRSRRKRIGHVWYFHAATMKKTWTRPVAETDELLMRLRKERRRATKKTKQAWKAVNDPTTWYRV